MTEWLSIIIRFALYVNLMLLFGLPLFSIYALRSSERQGKAALPLSALAGWLAVMALGLSALSITVMTASMAGVPVGNVDLAAIRMMMTDTPMGHAWLVRMAALVAIVLGAVMLGRGEHTAWLSLAAFAASIALGSLAWTGHGAATDGAVGAGHLVADIVHLLAGGAWLGALAALSMMLFRSTGAMPDDYARLIHRALEGFSLAGSVIVTLIVASGLMNSWILVGPKHVIDLSVTRYGQLLIAKLLLFTLMLGLAAINRFRLTPAFGTALKTGGTTAVLRRLRYSLILETSAALAVLGLVAWLGTLEPPMSM